MTTHACSSLGGWNSHGDYNQTTTSLSGSKTSNQWKNQSKIIKTPKNKIQIQIWDNTVNLPEIQLKNRNFPFRFRIFWSVMLPIQRIFWLREKEKKKKRKQKIDRMKVYSFVNNPRKRPTPAHSIHDWMNAISPRAIRNGDPHTWAFWWRIPSVWFGGPHGVMES